VEKKSFSFKDISDRAKEIASIISEKVQEDPRYLTTPLGGALGYFIARGMEDPENRSIWKKLLATGIGSGAGWLVGNPTNFAPTTPETEAIAEAKAKKKEDLVNRATSIGILDDAKKKSIEIINDHVVEPVKGGIRDHVIIPIAEAIDAAEIPKIRDDVSGLGKYIKGVSKDIGSGAKESVLHPLEGFKRYAKGSHRPFRTDKYNKAIEGLDEKDYIALFKNSPEFRARVSGIDNFTGNLRAAGESLGLDAAPAKLVHNLKPDYLDDLKLYDNSERFRELRNKIGLLQLKK